MAPPPHPPAEASDPPTLVVGVLGGIASGKSRVARGLAGDGGRVVDADALAHELLASADGAAFVAERFGPDALGPDGRPDRAALARLVFEPETGPASRRALEDWIHPRVRERIATLLGEARAAGVPVVVLDVPLLVENDARHGLARACDVLVFVDADAAARDARAQATRDWRPGEVARREAAQLPLAEKARRADHILENNGSLEDLDAAIESLRARLLQPRASPET